MKRAILGATGSVGRELVAQAPAAGHEVTALVRARPKPGEIDDRAALVAHPRKEVVRGPIVFTDGPRTGLSQAGPIGRDSGPCVSRADLADFMLAIATDGAFMRMKPLVSQY